MTGQTQPALWRVPPETRTALESPELLVDLAAAIESADAAAAGESRWSRAVAAAGRVRDVLRARMVPEAAPRSCQSPALLRVAEERLRQIERKRYDAVHDDQRTSGQLWQMACWWADPESTWLDWPYVDGYPEHGDRVADLVRAAALLTAEADRMLRLRAQGLA
ncbi:hypothetical protein [Solwaraspora sp. WMMD792]|uniref:hypothetical protein n=1 Tax=Solwaraspora sp. WMMD792 TaxID=3016099 RepID=UPI0024169E52|nr:hypothetical protein [Solwaraspora sp. WMMD792]MDG4768753.1 hypothetical protein [Solwaraspora sp. WMMD792]MDG4768792.1 hypothetical protein [Solwaraspora sp. WMMD792]MDG4768832.1 hypothetical protein [Solwaraspora sp. WMMD792]MDG4768852.1 hypothetical protein [Solwaraspora sp. WMMD792]MDG4768885.1 hypothetical protein [Solwaraspora sp. WMMD792]